MNLKITSLLFFFSIALLAQDPAVISVSPTSQSLSALPASEIVIEFNQTMNPATFNADTFLVFGRWSGPMQGNLTFSNNNATVTFTPARSFFYGESVSVRVSSAVMDAPAVIPLTNGYGFNFWIKTMPGVLEQEFVSQISAELPSETFIQCYGAYAGDVNDDEYTDLFVVTENANDTRLFLNDGEGNYNDFTIYDMPNANKPSPSEGSDFNHDGRIDVAVSSIQSNNISVFMGEETNIFGAAQDVENDQGGRGLVILDANGDGWDDMATANRIASTYSIIMNNGDGTFAAPINMDAGVDNETAIVAVDLTDNGITDLAIGGLSSNNIVTMINDGQGNFTLGNTISVSGSPWMLVAGDMNGDGKADVVSVNTNGTVAILTGDGSGELTNDAEYPVGSFSLAIDVGDIDGDGDLDFISSSFTGVNFTLYENDGTGNFINPMNYPAVSAGSCAILHDRDNNGTMDITLIDEIEDVIILYKNTASLSVEDENKAEILVGPNPFSNVLKVQGIHDFPADLKLFDIHGRLIYSETLTELKDIDLTQVGLANGLYLAEVSEGNTKSTFKLLKE